MDIIKKLQRSGLSEGEALVYHNILTNKGNTPGKIAQETNINRSTVYALLKKMAIQGLVSEIKRENKKFFQVEKPERIINAAKYKIQLAKESTEYAEDLVPILKNLIAKNNTQTQVQFYDNPATVIDAYMDHVHVEEGYEMLSFFNPMDLKKFLPIKKFKYYIKEKERLNITVRAIASEQSFVHHFQQSMFTGIEKHIWPQIKIIPNQVFPFPGEITLYGDYKISIVKFDTEKPVAVVIQDKDVYIMIKSIFEMLWSTAKSTPLCQKK